MLLELITREYTERTECNQLGGIRKGRSMFATNAYDVRCKKHIVNSYVNEIKTLLLIKLKYFL